jgi:hypothetical protein
VYVVAERRLDVADNVLGGRRRQPTCLLTRTVLSCTAPTADSSAKQKKQEKPLPFSSFRC